MELGGQSQDGVLRRHGVCVSSQLGQLPGTGGGPRTPKGTGRRPSDWVGCWGEGGAGEVEAGWDQRP